MADITQVLTEFPLPLPNRNTQSSSEFSDATDSFLGKINLNVTEENIWATQANALAAGANTDATNASDSAIAAAISEDLALTSANLKGSWSALTGELNMPASVYHNGFYWGLLTDLVVVEASEPTPGNTDWAVLLALPLTRTTGGGALSAGVINYLQDSNTYTLPLANSLSDGGYIDVELSETYSAFTPTVQVGGSDDLKSSAGIDPDGDIILNAERSYYLRFVTNGVDTWEI